MPKIKGNAYVVELGRLLQRRREYLGISREALADTLGTKYEVIRLYEEGQRIMKVDRLFEILGNYSVVHLVLMLHIKPQYLVVYTISVSRYRLDLAHLGRL